VSKYHEKFKDDFLAFQNNYAVVGRHIAKMVSGVSNTALILEGPAGVGKSWMVKHFMKANNHSRYNVIEGKITPLALYTNIHALSNRGDVLVLDDTDTALDNIDALNIIKAATDTNRKRTVSWISSKAYAALPAQFETEGSLIILTNNTFAYRAKSKKAEHLTAIMSRSLHHVISKDTVQNKFIQLCYMVHKQGMLSDLDPNVVEQLLGYMESKLLEFKQFDLRTAVKLSELYKNDSENWQADADVLL
jgi:hypothetical protein